MDPQLEQHLVVEANRYNLKISPNAVQWLDEYVNLFFRERSRKEKLVIETYLSQAALRIARTEKKRVVEFDDVKAAVWLFHLPEHPDDPCAAAGERALNEEMARTHFARGLLTESFKDFLNRQ